MFALKFRRHRTQVSDSWLRNLESMSMDLRKKRRGSGRQRARVKVKAAEVVMEGHCFAIVDDLPLCYGPS